MTGALAYLSWRSTVNRVASRLRRLREPRYLAGALVGALYVYGMFFRSRGRSSGGSTGLIPLLVRHQGLIEAAGALVLLLVTAIAWLLPASGRPALAFSQADVHLLFPAPLTRRQLVRYRVLRSQIGSTIGSALMTVVLRPSSVATGWTFFAGMFLIMTTINLHFTGVSLRRQSLGEHGMVGLARQWLPIALVLGAIGVVGAAVVGDWPSLSGLRSAGAIGGEIERVLSSGAVGVVLFPFRTVARMPVAGSAAVFLRELPFALAILAANYFWIERSDVAFEEASAEFAERRSAAGPRGRRIAPKVRAATTPFTLGLTGRPEIALVWKNLIMLGRYASLKLFVRLVPMVLLLGVFFSNSSRTSGAAHAMTIACVVTAGIAAVLGPQIVRNDLRRDLANLAVIRTWPLRGATVVRGEVLAPASVLIVMTWLLVLAATVVSSNMALADPLRFARRMDYAVAAALVAPGVILVQLIVHNAIAIAFPAWMQAASTRTRGVDVMGQRLLMLAGLLVVLVVAVLPAAIAGAVVAFAFRRVTGTVAVVIPAAVAAAVLLLECLIATEAAGALLDRTDVSALEPGE